MRLSDDATWYPTTELHGLCTICGQRVLTGTRAMTNGVEIQHLACWKEKKTMKPITQVELDAKTQKHFGLPVAPEVEPIDTEAGARAFLDRWLVEIGPRIAASPDDVFPVCALFIRTDPNTEQRIEGPPNLFIVPAVHRPSLGLHKPTPQQWLTQIRGQAKRLGSFAAATLVPGRGDGITRPFRYVHQLLEHPTGDIERMAELRYEGSELVTLPPVACTLPEAVRRLVPARFLD